MISFKSSIRKKNNLGLLFFTAISVLTTNICLAESNDVALSKIINNINLINKASSVFNVKPEYLSAIIYTERTLNYDWTDKAFDVILAKSGKNSSMGFCQIKFKTAYFIERQLNDSTLEFYPGKKYKDIIKLSKNPNELIRKLMSDSLNIFYAAAYLRIIQSKWSSAGFSVDDRPDIIGTLFQTGLFSRGGSLREPNPKPSSNKFGKKVLESVNLFIKKFSNNIGG